MQLTEATLGDILKGTSRAFYLSLAVLPAAARTPLSLAYLIARAADTIADAPAAPDIDRQALLISLKGALLDPEPWGWLHDRNALRSLHPEKTEEKTLLGSVQDLLDILEQRPAGEREAIRQVVGTLIDGMVWDQSLFAGAAGQQREKVGLDDEELEKYTYLVAGCVGPFWSKICALSDPRLQHLANGDYQGLAAEFGKGLQWVNILRDVPKDHHSGRYYLPRLNTPGFPKRFAGQARRAIAALSAASAYPLLFPARFLRHRMAVFWPLVLGLRTLEKLLSGGGPRPDVRVKVQRREVLVWVALSPLLVLSDTVLRLTLQALWRRAERALVTMEESHATTI